MAFISPNCLPANRSFLYNNHKKSAECGGDNQYLDAGVANGIGIEMRQYEAAPAADPFDTPGVGKRLRILFVDHTAQLGGAEIALLNLLRHLDRRYYEPVVLLFSEGPLKTALANEGVDVHVMHLSLRVVDAKKDALGIGSLFRFVDIGAVTTHAIKVARFIRSRDIDLVHTNSLKADVIGGLAAKLSGRKLLWQIHDWVHRDYLPPNVARAFRGICKVIPDYIIANSAATLACVAKPTTNIKLPLRTRVVHTGVDLDIFRPASRQVLSGKPCIGLVGRISPLKGQGVFVRAAASVLERFPQARFKIVGSVLFGEQDYERQVRELAKSLKLDQVIEFTGFRSDVSTVYSDLDLLVHASVTDEPFGQVVAEAMATGRPVVATRGGGIPELVDDGTTGSLVPMGNPEAMAKAICELLRDPEGARRMGEAGRRRIEQRFTIQHTVQQVETLYNEIAQQLNDVPSNRPLHQNMQPLRAEAGDEAVA